MAKEIANRSASRCRFKIGIDPQRFKTRTHQVDALPLISIAKLPSKFTIGCPNSVGDWHDTAHGER